MEPKPDGKHRKANNQASTFMTNSNRLY